MNTYHFTKKDIKDFLKTRKDKEFVYVNGLPGDKEGCVLCELFKSRRLKNFGVGPSHVRSGTNPVKLNSIPQWFINACDTARYNAQARWKFGGTFTGQQFLDAMK